MPKSKNVTAASTRPRRHTNSKKGPKNEAKSTASSKDSGFSSGSSSNNNMDPITRVPIHIQEAAYRLVRLKRGEFFDEEFTLPSIEPNDFEDEHYGENSYEVDDSEESMRQEESDDEINLPSIEPDDYEFETPRGSLKRKRDDSQTTDNDSASSPQNKKARRDDATRGAKGARRVTSGSVTDGYIKRNSSDEAHHFENETTYCEEITEASPTEAQEEDSSENVPARPKFEYVDEADMEDSYHRAALEFLRQKIGEAVDFFHELVGPEYPVYKATVDLKVHRRRSWGIPNKEGRPLMKLLVKNEK